MPCFMVKYFNLSSKYGSNYPYRLSSERTTVNFCTNLSIFKKFNVGKSKNAYWIPWLDLLIEPSDWIPWLDLSIELPDRI